MPSSSIDVQLKTGRRTKIQVWRSGLVHTTIPDQTLEVDGTGSPIAAGTDVTINLASALTEPIDAGNFLRFEDSVTGTAVLVEVTADATSTANSITGTFQKDIPDGSTASFPPEIYERTSYNLERSAETESTATNTDGGANRVVSTASDVTKSLEGLKIPNDPGSEILLKAFVEDNSQVWVAETDSPLDGFTDGEKIIGIASVTGSSEDKSPTALPTRNFDLQFSGQPTVIKAVPDNT